MQVDEHSVDEVMEDLVHLSPIFGRYIKDYKTGPRTIDVDSATYAYVVEALKKLNRFLPGKTIEQLKVKVFNGSTKSDELADALAKARITDWFDFDVDEEDLGSTANLQDLADRLEELPELRNTDLIDLLHAGNNTTRVAEHRFGGVDLVLCPNDTDFAEPIKPLDYTNLRFMVGVRRGDLYAY